ncbi:tetratricopeptide repeat protein [Streptomyces qinzhouensis]|uniref:Tetratricopeptide repeat protein n=1 Tax=Streptomyces qinzhouensis TaxID=2599401 RepID=A0A5B8JJB5_9ACTN|nr:tetratricopeptide repeat protein [Streptomyces qinzhouensis]QDY77613.1 tetratricopeptide repeat protein [Streptomyces qinzhouensis]
MLDTPEAVVEALRENSGRPHGLQRTVTAEELVEAAGAFEKADVLVTALIELMTAYDVTGEHRKSPVAFARLLKLWESGPGDFSDWEAAEVHRRFFWVTLSLLQVPDVPLATVDAWVAKMRERFAAAGHGLQPVAAARYRIAAHTGTGTDDAYDLWATRPRTEHSDCGPCEIRRIGAHRLLSGDDTGALDSWRPILDGRAECTEEPAMTRALALLPLLRAARADEARSHHLSGYRQIRGNTGMLEEVGLHLEFCALSRNEGRGLEILAENRPLFEAVGAPLARLGFLTGAEVLLARLAGDGHGATAVAGPPGRNWTVEALLTEVRTEADRLAAAFDARNGTTAVGDRRRARLDRSPLLDEPLPLGLRTSVARTVAPPTPVEAPAVPADFAGLVREARRLEVLGHPGAGRLWTLVADADAPHDPATGPEELLRAELAERRSVLHARGDRGAEAAEELEQAAELYEELGMPWHALSAQARALAWGPDAEGGDTDRAGTGLDGLLKEAERLLDLVPLTGGDPVEAEGFLGADAGTVRTLSYGTVLFCRTFTAYQALGRGPDHDPAALTRLEECARAHAAEAERLALPHQRASARQFLAEVAGRRGDSGRAETELRTALDDIAASERPWRGSRLRVQLAQFLLPDGRYEESAELLHRAITDAARYGDDEFAATPAHVMLGHTLSHLGDPGGAVRHLSEAAARYDRDAEHDDAAATRLQLADVLESSGRLDDAVAVLESVRSGADDTALGDRLLAQVRLNLARGLRALGEFRPAAEEFLVLADSVADWEDDDRAIHTLVAGEAAMTLALADRWDAAATAYERALAAHAEAPNPSLMTEMLREFARLTAASRGDEGLTDALAHLARADDITAAVPEGADDFTAWYERGSTHYRRARILAQAERFPEALTEAEAAIAAHEEGGGAAEASRAEAVRIAALIEGNGLERPDDAIARLTTAIARCRKADLDEAVRILEELRQSFMDRG